MPFIPSYERRARTEELLAGIEMLLEVKFCAEGLRLLPEIKEIKEVDKLQAIRAAFKKVVTIEELQHL